MSKKDTLPKSQPNFVRVPANVVTMQRQVDALMEFNEGLLQVLIQNAPALQQPVSQLVQGLQQRLAAVRAADGAMILQGQGPRGVLLSQSIKTEKDNKTFLDRLPKPSETPLTGDALMGVLQNYLTLTQSTPQGFQRGWVLPDAEMFGTLIRDGNAVANEDLTTQPDGIYVSSAEEGKASYLLKVTVGTDIILFAPATGPSIVSWSEVEQAWVQHTALNFVNGSTATEALEDFFAKANVHDVTQAELKRLASKVYALPEAKLEGLATRGAGGELTLSINELFNVNCTTDGAAEIVSIRDDLSWQDLSSFTRRSLFRALVKRVEGVASGSAPKKAAVKKVAKK